MVSSEEIQVHPAGTCVLIDRDTNTIGTKYPNSKSCETYSLDEEWVSKYRICRVCGKEVNNVTLAFAYWHLQAPACSSECLAAETLKRYACCELAKPLGCVCAYATTCPVHGERHHGTHD